MPRDRTGEQLDHDPVNPWDHHTCRNGWLHHPDATTPKPCPVCRPWLVERPPRPPTRTELDNFRYRHPPRSTR